MEQSEALKELQELVENTLSRGKQSDLPVAVVSYGLSRIGDAIQLIQDGSHNFGAVLGELRAGAELLRQGLPELRKDPGAAALVSLCERRLPFAELLQQEIVRLQAGETTKV
jgi:hypothetical protein